MKINKCDRKKKTPKLSTVWVSNEVATVNYLSIWLFFIGKSALSGHLNGISFLSIHLQIYSLFLLNLGPNHLFSDFIDKHVLSLCCTLCWSYASSLLLRTTSSLPLVFSSVPKSMADVSTILNIFLFGETLKVFMLFLWIFKGTM